MIKSRQEIVVDEAKVKEFNETTPTWSACCPVCHITITGTLPELRKHKHDK